MIRNGYARRLRAQEQRTDLVEGWQRYPGPVQYFLHVLLRDYGLQAAQIASRAVETCAAQCGLFVGEDEQASVKKGERNKMMHVLLDLYDCNPLLLADEEVLRSVLNAVPDLLGMQKTGTETLYYIKDVSNPDDAGHSGLMLAGNHMSLHA
jgi:hypothetical protein